MPKRKVVSRIHSNMKHKPSCAAPRSCLSTKIYRCSWTQRTLILQSPSALRTRKTPVLNKNDETVTSSKRARKEIAKTKTKREVGHSSPDILRFSRCYHPDKVYNVSFLSEFPIAEASEYLCTSLWGNFGIFIYSLRCFPTCQCIHRLYAEHY
jgi:hypothetical protein